MKKEYKSLFSEMTYPECFSRYSKQEANESKSIAVDDLFIVKKI